MEILQDEILRNSGSVGNNSKAGRDIAGRDIKTNILNIFGKNRNQKSEIFNVVKSLDKRAKLLYRLDEISDFNPDWQEKIDFNSLNTWKKIFENRAAQLEKFEEEIISNLTVPEILLLDLSNKYARLSNENISSDSKCMLIEKQLLETVNGGRSDKICEENKTAGIELTIYWAFTRCQILENPPR